jgi:hypothetical protein
MSAAFERYIGIDYSGAETCESSLQGLRVYIADRPTEPCQVAPPPSPRWYWSRKQIAQWLVERLSEPSPTLVGIDHGFSFPLRYVAESLTLVSTHEPRMILATGSYLGEGFDDARLDTLFLAMPISWRGTLQQYVGRLHRLHENKKEVLVYDYSDVLVPMLARMYKKRLAGYSALGYVVTNGFTD